MFGVGWGGGVLHKIWTAVICTKPLACIMTVWGWMEREKDYQCTVFVCWFVVVVVGGGGLNENLFKCKKKIQCKVHGHTIKP